MKMPLHMAVLLAALAALLCSRAAASQIPAHFCSGGNYSSASSYHRSLGLLSGTLPQRASLAPRLVARDSAGTGEVTYALAQCRGDLDSASCSSCIQDGLQLADVFCGLRKEAFLAYELCTLRLSGTTISWSSSQVNVSAIQIDNVTVQSEAFDLGIGALCTGLGSMAAHRPEKFATAFEEVAVDGKNYTVYGLAQCTPELTPADCVFCLEELSSVSAVLRRSGGWFSTSWCTYQFHTYRFFRSEPIQLPTVTSNTPRGDRKKKKRRRGRILVGVTVGASVVAVLVLLSVIAALILRRRKRASQKTKQAPSRLNDEEEAIASPTAEQAASKGPTEDHTTTPSRLNDEEEATGSPTAEQAGSKGPTEDHTTTPSRLNDKEEATGSPTAEQAGSKGPTEDHTTTPSRLNDEEETTGSPTAEQAASKGQTEDHTTTPSEEPTAELKDPTEERATGEHSVWEACPSALDFFDDFIARAQAKKMFLFLDYDGTLSKIVSDPANATITVPMREAIEATADSFSTSIVTGRDVPKAIGFVQLDNLHYAGSHGLDIKILGEEHHYQPFPYLEPLVTKATESLKKALEGIDGALVENNKFCVSAHYRNVDEKDWDLVEAAVKTVLIDFPELRLETGKMVWEFRTKEVFTKGNAVEYLLNYLLKHQQLHRSRVLAIHIGDDKTDEDAFKMLREKGYGFGIVVTTEPKPTQALFSLRDPSEVMEFLQKLVRWKREDGIVEVAED